MFLDCLNNWGWHIFPLNSWHSRDVLCKYRLIRDRFNQYIKRFLSPLPKLQDGQSCALSQIPLVITGMYRAFFRCTFSSSLMTSAGSYALVLSTFVALVLTPQGWNISLGRRRQDSKKCSTLSNSVYAICLNWYQFWTS